MKRDWPSFFFDLLLLATAFYAAHLALKKEPVTFQIRNEEEELREPLPDAL